MNLIERPTLLEDMDSPIVKSVALLNLWGMKTIWSCCGFDYKGQSDWKSHLYGRPYIRYLATSDSFDKTIRLIDNDIFAHSRMWNVSINRPPKEDPSINISCSFPVNNLDRDWSNPKCAHFHEVIVTSIKALEEKLLEFQDEFMDEVIVIDRNTEIKERLEHWQFEGKKPWIVKKQDYI